MKSVLTLTLNPSLDVATTMDQVRNTDKLRCAAPKTDPGGGGINVARVMTRLGGAAKVVFTAGGPNGRALEDLLAAEGIGGQAIHISGSTRQSFTVFERVDLSVIPFCHARPGTRCFGVSVLPRSSPDVARRCRLLRGKRKSLSPCVSTDFYAHIARLSPTSERNAIDPRHVK